MEQVTKALNQYGAYLTSENRIGRDGKILGIRVVIKSNRIRFESSSSGQLYASGPIEMSTVEKFVEAFWQWEKL